MSVVAPIFTRTINAVPMTRAEAAQLVTCDLCDLLHAAHRIRHRFFNARVGLCAIVNAKAGGCGEDCAFCAQSARHATNIRPQALLSAAQLTSAVQDIASLPVNCCGVITSGGTPVRGKDRERLLATLQQLAPASRATLSVSLGQLDQEMLAALRAAGIRRIHHNLETSRRFFPQICTTHTYDDRLQTLRRARAMGFSVCSGGIFGMGETWEDRIDLAFALYELDIRSIPLNFLHPIPGTPLANQAPLQPLEILRIIAMFRFILPTADLKVAGGRDVNLRDVQSWIFYAGATSMMVGNYLTTRGRALEADLQMLRDLDLSVTPPVCAHT